MKRIFYIVVVILMGTLAIHANDKFFEKFSNSDNHEGVTYINISKTLLKMMPQGTTEINHYMDLNVFVNELDRIQILTCEENKAVIEQMRAESKVFQKAPYEEIMQLKEDDEDVSFYIQPQNDGKIKELIMLVDYKSDLEFTVIRLIGNISIENLQKSTKKMY